MLPSSRKRDLYVAPSHVDLRISSESPPPPASLHILNSWKEIASYLGRGVRTTQRYEQKLGLPVHRPAGRERSAVVAFADELERWLRNAPSRNATYLNPGNGDSAVGPELSDIHLKNDVRSELARAKKEMERAHAEYRRTLENYNALKRRVETAEAGSHNGKMKRTG